MRIGWFLLITVHLVCGKSEESEEIAERHINGENSIELDDEREVEQNFVLNSDNNFPKRKRSVEAEDRIKKEQKFHSWGGKRFSGNEEKENLEDSQEGSTSEYDDNESGTTHSKNQSFHRFLGEENIYPNVQGLGELLETIPEKGKRVPDVTNDVRKRARLYDSIFQNVGFRPELSEQSSKRYPAFNSWAGKRSAAFNSWGGKRAPFSSWGGKRAAPFNSWGGKRNAAFNSWGGKRKAAFNSWGGKRKAAFNSWGGKRYAAFNSWGGKRAPNFNSWNETKDATFDSWGEKSDAAYTNREGSKDDAFLSLGGKRAAPFNSWGGKRTATFNDWGENIDLRNLNNWKQEQIIGNHNSANQANGYDKKINDINVPNEQNNDVANTIHYNTERINEKRGAAFNSWGGKRNPAVNRWAGLRSAPGGKKSAAFNSWGGKRASTTSFNSWGGKRGPSFNSWAGKRFTATLPVQDPDLLDNSEDVQNTSSHKVAEEALDTGDHDEEFQSPGAQNNNKLLRNLAGQWHWLKPAPDSDIKYYKIKRFIGPGRENSWSYTNVENGFGRDEGNEDLSDYISEKQLQKRSTPAFSSWAGKRTPLFTPWYANKMPSLLISSGKRRPAFSSWGGKRSEPKPLQKTNCYNLNGCPDLTSNNLGPSDEQDGGVLRKKREVDCSSEESISGLDTNGKRICRGKNLDGGFKKSRIMTRMLFQGGLLRPTAIKSLSRGIDFYAWGGKRSL